MCLCVIPCAFTRVRACVRVVLNTAFEISRLTKETEHQTTLTPPPPQQYTSISIIHYLLYNQLKTNKRKENGEIKERTELITEDNEIVKQRYPVFRNLQGVVEGKGEGRGVRRGEGGLGVEGGGPWGGGSLPSISPVIHFFFLFF